MRGTMKIARHRKRVVLVASGILLLTLSACGGGISNSTSNTQQNTAALRFRAAVQAARGNAESVTLRTATDTINRVTPLMIMLTPTSVPIAQAELEGHRT